MRDEMWMIALLGTLTGWALVASVLWLRERRESREWQVVCQCLGDQYDRLQAECVSPRQRPEQRSIGWLN